MEKLSEAQPLFQLARESAMRAEGRKALVLATAALCRLALPMLPEKLLREDGGELEMGLIRMAERWALGEGTLGVYTNTEKAAQLAKARGPVTGAIAELLHLSFLANAKADPDELQEGTRRVLEALRASDGVWAVVAPRISIIVTLHHPKER